mmetsp:Transcript_1001/g.1421  ORF Transcript_1001/g.1421 Transcript_1001/m.1421 type:complete len:85 (+) Transcript_1001:1128-1382(+)
MSLKIYLTHAVHVVVKCFVISMGALHWNALVAMLEYVDGVWKTVGQMRMIMSFHASSMHIVTFRCSLLRLICLNKPEIGRELKN